MGAAVGGGLVLGIGLLLGAWFVVPVQWLGRVLPGHLAIDQTTEALIVQKPGSARPTDPRVRVDAAGVDEPIGQVLFLTVAVDSQLSIFDWLQAELDDDMVLRNRSEVFGNITVAENRTRNLEMMRVSKDVAVVVALRHLGIEVVEETGQGFEGVVEGGPVDGILEPGDVITGIDGAPITTFASLRAALDTKVPGETGVVTVDNIDTDETRDVEVTWGRHPDGRSGGFLGIEYVVPVRWSSPSPSTSRSTPATSEARRPGWRSRSRSSTCSRRASSPGKRRRGHRHDLG
ncbi:MAG: PDZ domain-containing protein [Acidimicrobiales bacterium]